MDKKSLNFCFQVLLSCLIFSFFIIFAYQKPKEFKRPLYPLPYVEIAYAENNNPSSLELNPSILLDTSPLFLATGWNASCLPAPQLPLATPSLENGLEPLLSLTQNLKILPIQPTLLSDPAELSIWNLSINLEPSPPSDNLDNTFPSIQHNTQILNLLSHTRKRLSLDFSLENQPLPLLEDLELLVLRDCSGYTLPFLKRNTLGDELLDQTVIEHLMAAPPFYSIPAATYEEYRISL